MGATGSRPHFSIQNVTALRLLLGALLLLAVAGLSAVFATERADAGAVAKLTVNSTSNTDDGKCHGPPNDNAVGNCTLREAINAVNAGLADEINFHPSVFPESNPGIIFLDLGFGPLPPINREVKIDAKLRGVILDGDFDDDGFGVPWGVLVIASHNAFDFELNGGGETFIIRDVGCDPGIAGHGEQAVDGPGPFPLICILGAGEQGVSGPGIIPGVGLLIAGLCEDTFFETTNGSVSGPFLPCCPFLAGAGSLADDVSGPGICCSGGGGGVQGPGCLPGEGEDGVSGSPVIVGGNFSLGDVIVDGIEVHNAMTAAGVVATGTNINNFQLTDSWIEADLDGVDVFAFSPPSFSGELTNNNVHINRNLITGGQGGAAFVGDGEESVAGKTIGDARVSGPLLLGNGVAVELCCDVGSKLTVDVSDNDAITGKFGFGVGLSHCLFGSCSAEDGSQFNYSVNNNGKIAGLFGGIAVGIFSIDNSSVKADGEGAHLDANIDINGNAIIDGEEGFGVGARTEICCRQSDSTSITNVTNNLDIVGSNDGVVIDTFVNEGPDNLVEANVNDNGEITAESDEGVDITVEAGSDNADETDSDENTARVSVSGNDDIAGDDSMGVFIEAVAGKWEGPGDADRNVTEVRVNGNGNIDGNSGGEGVFIEARAGTEDGPGDADDNTVLAEVNGNGTIDGSDQGIEVVAVAGHTSEAPVDNVTGDGNMTSVVVDGNGEVKGHGDDGVDVHSRAGGLQPTGEENHTSVRVVSNDELQGFGEGNGVKIESLVCCDPDLENGGQTNFVEVSGNGDIIGTDANGIDINRLCCSINTVLIQNNTGVIKGNEDNGIEVSPCLESGDPTDPTSISTSTAPEGDLTCLDDSVTELVITGNNISDSGRDGILVCCGDFQFPANQAPAVSGDALKSLIQDNTISHNGEDGIDLDTTNGINVIENEIFQNGTSATDGDNGVEIDWQFGWMIVQGTCFGGGAGNSISGGVIPTCVKVPAHFNRISKNSIYDNAGLGINLIGIVSFDPPIGTPSSGTEFPGWPLADGVGCIQYEVTPVAANDCIPYPKVLFTGGPTIAKVSGEACANCIVEVFVADSVPADQTGPLGRQFGEGRTYLVSTEADELGEFSVNLPCGLPAGELTATNTDKLKNTSEFASNIPFPGTPACAAATAQPSDTPAPATSTPVPPTATSVPVEPTATPGPAGLCGDVNSDGAVNSIDAALILQEGAGMIEELPKGNASGDVNGDGVTNAVDAALILQDAASMIAGGLPC